MLSAEYRFFSSCRYHFVKRILPLLETQLRARMDNREQTQNVLERIKLTSADSDRGQDKVAGDAKRDGPAPA